LLLLDIIVVVAMQLQVSTQSVRDRDYL
jgi:hypothetical protein